MVMIPTWMKMLLLYGLGYADLSAFGNFKVSGNATYNKIEDLDDLTQRTYNVAFNTHQSGDITSH